MIGELVLFAIDRVWKVYKFPKTPIIGLRNRNGLKEKPFFKIQLSCKCTYTMLKKKCTKDINV